MRLVMFLMYASAISSKRLPNMCRSSPPLITSSFSQVRNSLAKLDARKPVPQPVGTVCKVEKIALPPLP
ncbi:hypothetical protein D3C86_2098670 [compost metagenome]